jgi:hypothetical protein
MNVKPQHIVSPPYFKDATGPYPPILILPRFKLAYKTKRLRRQAVDPRSAQFYNELLSHGSGGRRRAPSAAPRLARVLKPAIGPRRRRSCPAVWRLGARSDSCCCRRDESFHMALRRVPSRRRSPPSEEAGTRREQFGAPELAPGRCSWWSGDHARGSRLRSGTRWFLAALIARRIEAHVIHATSITVSRDRRRAETDRPVTALLMRVFSVGFQEVGHCTMAAVPGVSGGTVHNLGDV